MTDIQTEDIPVAHVHENEVDEAIQAYCTTITVTLAHTADSTPQEVVQRVSETLTSLDMRGVVVGVSSVELRGSGGLIGL